MKKNQNPAVENLLSTKNGLQAMYRNAKGDTRRELAEKIDNINKQIKSIVKGKTQPAVVVPMSTGNPASMQRRASSGGF